MFHHHVICLQPRNQPSVITENKHEQRYMHMIDLLYHHRSLNHRRLLAHAVPLTKNSSETRAFARTLYKTHNKKAETQTKPLTDRSESWILGPMDAPPSQPSSWDPRRQPSRGRRGASAYPPTPRRWAGSVPRTPGSSRVCVSVIAAASIEGPGESWRSPRIASRKLSRSAHDHPGAAACCRDGASKPWWFVPCSTCTGPGEVPRGKGKQAWAAISAGRGAGTRIDSEGGGGRGR